MVHISFDFALRRSTYRFLKLLGRGVSILGRVGMKAVAKKTKKKELSPFQHWETSKAKLVMNVYVAALTEDDDDYMLGSINVDPKAPADMLREYVRRTFQAELNEGPFGDSFLFRKEKKGGQPEIFPRAVEPKRYAKDMTVLRMDHKTMETALCVVIIPEPNVPKVLVEIAPDIDSDDEDATKPEQQQQGANGAGAGAGGDDAKSAVSGASSANNGGDTKPAKGRKSKRKQ